MVHFLIGRAAKRVLAGWVFSTLPGLHTHSFSGYVVWRLAEQVLWSRDVFLLGRVERGRLLLRFLKGCSFSADWNVLASLARMI